MWDILSGRLEEFYQAWESKSPPDLEKFLPERPIALRRFALNELIKVDLELRYEQGLLEKSLKDYVSEFPEILQQGKIAEDLLFEEIELRKRHSLKVEFDEYKKLFPAQEATLLKLLGGPQATKITKLPTRTLASITTGSTIDDFELILELGKGAFATVYLARQISMQRLVALKISDDRGDEPKTLAQLDCKNIVRVYDVRDIPDPKCRLLYMKFVAGGSLHDVATAVRDIPLEDRSGALVLSLVDQTAEKSGQDIPLDSRTRQRLLQMEWFEVVFWVGSEIAEGLAYAHLQDVLHRDLKPANILLTTEGIPQIADFNVSFCSQVEGSTAESFFGGSLAYMSPEQLEAFDPEHMRQPEELTACSDIYSLGVILWELLFGRRPFGDQVADGDYSSVLKQLVKQRQEFQVKDHLPDEADRMEISLEPVFELMLSSAPEDRAKQAEQVSGELSLMSDRQARELLRPKPTRWSMLFQKYLVVFVVVSVVVPSALAAVFNYFYNFDSIIRPKGDDVAETFQRVQLIINLIAFPLGIGLLITLSFQLYKKLFQQERSRDLSTIECRRHILQLPLIAVLVPISIWTAAGLAYPIAMNLGNAAITVADSFHFLTSLILCGLIASVYPFFLISYVAIRYWYPAAFRTNELRLDDAARIEELNNRVWFFMLLGVMLPTFSMLLMVVTQRENDRFLLAVLAGSSFIALGAVFVIFQKLQRHLETVSSTISRMLEK